MDKITFKQRMGDSIICCIADNLNSEIDRIEDIGRPLTDKDSVRIFKIVEEQIKSNLSNIRFDKATSERLTNAFERAVNAATVFDKDSYELVLKIYHLIDARFKKSKEPEKHPVSSTGFLVKTGVSNKFVDPLIRQYFIAGTINFNYASKSFNDINYNYKFFKGSTPEEQKQWLEQAVAISKNEFNLMIGGDSWFMYRWLANSFSDQVDSAIRQHNKSFCTDMVIFTLEYEANTATLRKLTDRFEFKDKSSIAAIQRLRTYMFGDETAFKKNLEVAKSLDLLRDRAFWLGVSLNNEPVEIKEPNLATVEF